MNLKIAKQDKIIQGKLRLDGSKSISNRALIIQALCPDDFVLFGLSTSEDTTTLQRLLAQINDTVTLDAGAAGTTFRFLTAYLSFQSGTQILTGSERMQQRPIGVLVDALRLLGAKIDYLGNEGYPPLKIHASTPLSHNQLSIDAGTSSQYISALIMLAPTLPNGLELTLVGDIVSRSYIEITISMMKYFGVESTWNGNTIKINPQEYKGKDFTVEADWSAASYHYAFAILADEVDLQLEGVYEESVQGDSITAQLAERFGVKSIFNTTGVHLSKSEKALRPVFEWDFIRCPDIAQTFAVICGAKGVQGLFTGLRTLSIKETDRVVALQNELDKIQVWLSKLPPRFSKKNPDKVYYMIDGNAVLDSVPCFQTYEDHRMAMSFAPLALFGMIEIENPQVVRKSYPNFWKDLTVLGFEISLE